MKKLKLKLDDLDVESFRASGGTSVQGTVNAQSGPEMYGESEVSGCTCTTGGTAFFTEGCAAETWYTAHPKAC